MPLKWQETGILTEIWCTMSKSTETQGSGPCKSESVIKVSPGALTPGARQIARETPTALVYNGISHVVMMTTPAELEDFAIGFSLSEGIVEDLSEITELDIRFHEAGATVNMTIPKSHAEALVHRQRNIVGQTGCGLCGVSDIEDAVRTFAAVGKPPRLSTSAIFSAVGGLDSHQDLNRATGAVHAAAFYDKDCRLIAVREDVGRHNAFDKLIGDLARRQIDPRAGWILLSSRCSYELVQKALAIGCPMLVTISAPTELGVSLARQHGLTLVALARPDSMLCFNDPAGMFA